jgi:hypothetical protein
MMINKWWVFERPIEIGLHAVSHGAEYECKVPDLPAELVMEHCEDNL